MYLPFKNKLKRGKFFSESWTKLDKIFSLKDSVHAKTFLIPNLPWIKFGRYHWCVAMWKTTWSRSHELSFRLHSFTKKEKKKLIQLLYKTRHGARKLCWETGSVRGSGSNVTYRVYSGVTVLRPPELLYQCLYSKPGCKISATISQRQRSAHQLLAWLMSWCIVIAVIAIFF